jgi:hypothetical protein
MRKCFYLLLFLAVLITTGCTSDDNSAAVTPAQTIVTSPTLTGTPTPAPTPEPIEMAYLENMDCAVVEERVTTYRCIGKVRIKSGIYSEVQITARYPDNNTFDSGIFAMGGSDPTLKLFMLFPDLKYRNQNPVYSVKLDKIRYFVIMNGTTGIAYQNYTPAWSNITSPVVTATTPPISGKPTIQPTTMAGSTPTLRWISPNTGSASTGWYTINGTNFRQYPPSDVYFRKHGSACEYCGIRASKVEYLNPTEIRCIVDMGGSEAGPSSYDVLVTNSYLADSYGILQNGLTITDTPP